MRKKSWSYTEERILIENYQECTIAELEGILTGRNQESINCKIKRLKAAGKIKEGKDEKAVARAYFQRSDRK
jgi:hypothetical protein